MSNDDESSPRRRGKGRFQFGLSTLLLAILLMAVPLTWQRERILRWVDSLWLTPPPADPLLGPITSGGLPTTHEPPTEAEILAALSGRADARRFIQRAKRSGGRMTLELIAEYVDPPQFYPIIGRAQLHHAHYKCTAYYTEMTRDGWPLPDTTVDEEHSEVIYIDHNHFHLADADDARR